ncbi:hypothetical protein NUW58_g3664 [Xylaria curta]|uniref:Uncharacterized protein n=1 Tax=Xylaria curta TaxID=42375 RepID=A0ACC1P9W6_9PEZI|nr:hypothetical protein NUW58_g3664 [Xylaria curta]
MLGAHLDSVLAGPGVNDDGSGSSLLLELLTEFRYYQGYKNKVRFAWWGTEESGLVGSLYYTANLKPEEADKIRFYFNYDMVGSPFAEYQIYVGDNSANGLQVSMVSEFWDGVPLTLSSSPASRVLRVLVVRTRKAVYQVKRFNPYDDEDAAFIRRALQQQEAENDDIKDMKEKMQTMDVDTLDDVDLANVLDRYDDDIHDSDGIGMKLADLSEIESPSLRKAQLDGLVAQLLYTLGEVEKAQSTLGVWDIGLFDALLEPLSTSSSKTDHARLAPEWSPNKSRDKPYIANVRMNNALGLEEDLFDFLQNNAGTVAPVA